MNKFSRFPRSVGILRAEFSVTLFIIVLIVFKLAHQFWISYHPPSGAKHTSGGDETPPIPEEELEQQKIEHERQMQKEKECQAREAEEVRKLDIKLLHQRAIEAEEEHKREIAEAVEELRGLNTSWSHHRLCDLQRQAARWRHSRPSIPDTKHYRNALKKACSAQLTKPQSSQSISDNDGISINLSRLSSCRGESMDSDGCCETPCCITGEESQIWRASANDISHSGKGDLHKTTSCIGKKSYIDKSLKRSLRKTQQTSLIKLRDIRILSKGYPKYCVHLPKTSTSLTTVLIRL